MTISQPTKENIETAVRLLQQGDIVAFATETVYGLGCDTFNKSAIQKVYTTKGRPKNNPMIAHVLDSTWVATLTDSWNKQCESLSKTFWPGPLTLVVPKNKSVPTEACGGLETIAIRCPSNTVARQLLQSFGAPVSAPSANRSGYISPTTAEHVETEFGGDLYILDGGPCETGIESTVLSLVSEPTILRPGAITKEQIEDVIGPVFQQFVSQQSESPGTSLHHYTPTTVTLLKTEEEVGAIDNLECVVLSIHKTPLACKHHIQMPETPNEYAAVLYAALREADLLQGSLVVIEQPPCESSWVAINDRVSRCCSQ